MRLTKEQIQIIKATVREVFGPKADVWLFGSRVDDTLKGGDIDLLIEAFATPEESFDKELALYARLIRQLGDQRIDIVVHNAGKPSLPVHEVARQTGQLL